MERSAAGVVSDGCVELVHATEWTDERVSERGEVVAQVKGGDVEREGVESVA